MANFFTDNDDLRWYIERGIDWEPLVRTTEADFRNPDGPKSVAEALAFYQETLEMVGGFVADEIAPHAAELDREGVRHEGGEAVFPPRLAGHLRPDQAARPARPVRAARARRHERAGDALLSRVGAVRARRRQRHGAPRLPRRHGDGDAACSACARGRPRSIPSAAPSSRRAFATFIEEIVRGEAWGCMDITEPDAGSDMARLRAQRRAGRRRQLVRDRAEDLHHLGARQVSLRHRAHRAGQGSRTIR